MRINKKIRRRAIVLAIAILFSQIMNSASQAGDGDMLWSYETGSYIYSSPAIGPDDTVYFGSTDKIFYACLPNGTVKWAYETGDMIVSSPAIDSKGIIYFGSNDDYLYALNPDGTLRWRFQTSGDIQSSPAIGQDGTIYVGSYDKYFYAVNPNGSMKWSYLTSGYVYSSPAIADDGTVYVGSNDNRLYAFNSSGSVKWSYVTGHYVRSSPVVGTDGTIYVGSNDNKLYAIHSDGTLKWAIGTGSWVNPSPAIGIDGTIYVGSNDNNVYAINPTGTQKWYFATQGNVISSPVIDSEGTIYVGSSDNRLYAIKPDGSLKWSFMTGGYVRSSPAIDPNGTVYFGSYDQKFYAIEITEINPPRVIQVTPSVNSQNVPITSAISAIFSEAIDPATITTSTFFVSDGHQNIGGTVSYDNVTARFTPANLAYHTSYQATLTTGITDLAGNAMKSNYTWSFTTVPDNCPDDPGKTEPGVCGCGVPDIDSDGDLVLDCKDSFPSDATEWQDNDSDGIGDNQDTDDDNDGMPDSWEDQHGLDPLIDDSMGDPDGDGFTNIDEYINGTDPATDETIGESSINLETGWNLISFSRQPVDTDIASVVAPIAGQYESLWAFENNHWEFYDPSSPAFSDLDSMESGKGYWILMNQNNTLDVSGESAPASISLASGWNLVGYNANASIPITEAMSSIQGSYRSIWTFSGGGWQGYDPSMPELSNLMTLDPGHGYWIDASEACVWSLP